MVVIHRASLELIAKVMADLIKCDPFKAVYFRGKMISPTLPSSSMTF